MEMRSSSVSSVVAPQSVPSRISVVLVEEAEVRGAKCLASAPVDKDLRLLASAACPASVTVCEDCVISPGVVGTLSPSDSVGPAGPDGTLSTSDLAGILFPAVPAGIPFPVGPVWDAVPVWDAALIRPCRNTVSGRSCWDTVPSRSCLGHYPRLTRTALWARMGRCPRLTLNMPALLGCCPSVIM